MAKEAVIIAWTPSNWITVVLMVGIVFFIISAGARIGSKSKRTNRRHRKKEGQTYHGNYQLENRFTPTELGHSFSYGVHRWNRYSFRSYFDGSIAGSFDRQPIKLGTNRNEVSKDL